uniref:Tudor domain containing 6 n=1 Tax=Callorhinchus milii TaxID=7868 RepID=A0A4W3I021_CALMI
MSSTGGGGGLPPSGVRMPFQVTRVDPARQGSVLVRLWGRFHRERQLEYQRLHDEIQNWVKGVGDGGAGGAAAAAGRDPPTPPLETNERCLAEMNGEWHRARVVSRAGDDYTVFTLDEGRATAVRGRGLERGKKDFFQLPPEAVCCILANLVPGAKPTCWPPSALSFLRSLQGRELDGYVDAVLPNRLVLLDVPRVSRQLCESGLAKVIGRTAFRLLVEMSTSRPATVGRRESAAGTEPGPLAFLNYFYPLLQVDETVTVTVRVTHVRYPDRFFCQLRCHCPELERLHLSMHRYYESSRVSGTGTAPRKLGSPCAAKSLDGRWYRAVVQQTLSDRGVEVFLVDYGNKEVVSSCSIRKLSPGYFKMPVVTYPFALREASDYGRGWSAKQIELLHTLIINKVLQAKIEFYNSVENVYYVTLYREDGSTINAAFNAQVESVNYERVIGYCEDNELRGDLLKNANLKLNAFYDALVEFVKDPTEFWIRTMDTASEFEKLMNSIAKKYGPLGRNEGLVKKPEPGLLCCAKFKADHLYYRAVITEILDGQFRVFFIDYGNLELVDWHDVKALLPEYRKLPALAVKCCLADLVPKEATWSKEAIAYFEKVVFEKHLVVHVLDKEMDKYLIELLDVEDEGEPSVNKIMLQEGYADQKDSNDCLATVLSNMPYKISSHGEIETGDTRTQNIAVMDSAITESPYKQEYLKVGSTVDVQVSYIDEPGDFWCQLTKNAHELKMLMSKIQEYYNTHADHSQPCQSACIAKYSEDGKWYRALILGKVSALEVDVLYVDYGNRERVSFSDLCAIRPEFLLLKGQAFRCSLYNIIQPMGSDPFMWNVDSVAAFQEFIDSALSLYMELKCTVYALTIVDGKGLCNVVDLNTPFQSACQLLIERGLAKFVGSPSVLAPSVNLYTYYYSTHDVKIGSEEEMYVSHVTSPTKFYCLLSRNLDIVDKLADKVNKLSCKLPDYKFSQGVDPICLAKYTDNQWYRALAWPIQDRIRVSFVDYGNKLDVDKDDLLPIPDSARDVKFLPMQAIKCGLSDIPAELSLDINTWFRKAVTDKPLKAVVVAKESDGKLIVELYDGNVQINAKIKEQLYLQGTSEAKTMNGNSGRQKIKSEKLCSTFMVKSDHEPSLLKRRIIEDQDEVHEAEKAAVSSHTQDRWKNRTEIFIVENVEAELKCAPNMDLKNVKEFSDVKSNVETRNNKSVKSNVEKTSFSKLGFDTSKLPLPKEIDIPLITLKPGFKCEARISHVVSPSHFFVHLSQHDDKVTMMEEKLNASWANDTEVECFQYESLQLGDMVCAESPEDGSHYRSVVTQKIANNLVGVEFIDYGNTVNVQPSKIHLLIKVINMSKPNILEVDIYVNLDNAVRDQLTASELAVEKDESNTTTYGRYIRKIPLVGQTIEGYVTAAESPSYFWCQYSASEIQMLAEKMQELGKREDTGTKLSSISVGDSCFCKYSEDEQFYRAEVKKTNSNILSLNYVDYGNEEDVEREQVRKLPEELLKIPVQAFPCCLSGYDLSEGSWKDGAVGDFLHLLSDQLLKITALKNECGKGNVPFVLHVQIESSSGIINDTVKTLWKPHTNKHNNSNLCDEKKLPADQSLSLQSLHNDKNLEAKLMEDIIPNAACPERLNAEELVQFRMDDHGEEMDGNSPATYLVEEKVEAQENSESEVDLQFQKLGDETDNEVQILKLSESHSSSVPGSFLIADNLEMTVIDQLEGPASSSCPNDWIPTMQAYMDQCLSSSQTKDADLENANFSLQPVKHKMRDNLEDSSQTIDLYEEIFKCQNDQPFMEDTGDDSMTRLLISQDEDSEDQNLPETQMVGSETEHFETGE